MLIKKPEDIQGSEITRPEDQEAFLSRRTFLRGAALAGTALGTAWLYRRFAFPEAVAQAAEKIAVARPAQGISREALTSLQDITHYNNFYEFSTDKGDVAALARAFVTRPWTVEVGGLVQKPRTFGVDDLLKRFPQEERIYRMRCVEGWSMVIPWVGFPLAALLAEVQPLGSATHVAFQSLADPRQMPNIHTDILDWPYVEGLRLDEAMHPLVLLASGLYGQTLLPQNGAPLRLVVPWKYGFKGIKSLVKITLVDKQPPATWNLANAHEYGFYSNVNPNVDHPRWSQATEQRIGESGRRPTLMFNGYADQVANLYAGMDLRANY